MKNLEQRNGFLNRHTNGLPNKTTKIKVVIKDFDGEHIYLCVWKPFDKNQYLKYNMPTDGYLGTAKVIEGKYAGIGFHAWEQNNYEFVWYAVI